MADSTYLPPDPYQAPKPSETQPQELPPSSTYELPSSVNKNNFSDEDEVIMKRSMLAIVSVILIILILGGGSVWYYLSRRGETGAPIKQPPPRVEPGDDEGVIRATNGGKIVSPDGFEVTIPPGALPQDMKIEIERVSLGRVTDLYHLKPDGLRFLKPVMLAIPYKPAGLYEGETPYDIILKYWYTQNSPQLGLQYSVDLGDTKLRTQVERF